MEPSEVPSHDSAPGGIYLLGGQLVFTPTDSSIRCVTRNQSGLRCVTKLPWPNPWQQVLVALPTDSGLTWVRAVQVSDHLTDQYAAQHCTRHHTASEPVQDDVPPQWETYNPQRHPGAHELRLPTGRWTPLPFNERHDHDL